VLFDGAREQGVAVLGAMAAVAAASSAGVLTDTDRGALVAAARVVFRDVDHVDPDALVRPNPEELAHLVTDPDLAWDAVAFLVVMATVDGQLDPAATDLVEQYADALDVDTPAVHDLADLAHGQLAEARADMVRRNLESISGEWLGDGFDEWVFPYRDRPDPDLVSRYEALGDLSAGTFGQVFHEFYMDNGFPFAGDPDGANEQFATRHDSTHVLSGYDTSPQGELLVSAFTGGMHADWPLAGHILPVIVSWHLGIGLTQLAGSTTGSLDAPKFWRAWSRGDEVTGDTFSPDWDFWAHTPQPLDDVRAAMTVPVLDPADAADGRYPDWYKPSS
jgi:hypothetical protein